MKYLFFLLALCACAIEGPRGYSGLQGPPGNPGLPGSSCSVEQAENGSVITCDNGSTAVILNGTNGVNGQDGTDGQNGIDGQDGTDGQDGSNATPTAYSVVEVIKPCPGSGFREVLLRTYNNQILAHYSQGSKQFLTFLTPGNYQLTDGSGCNFTVHQDMSVTW